jgi:hypothetical protein
MDWDANGHDRTRLRLLSPKSTSAPSSSYPRAAGPFPATRQVLRGGGMNKERVLTTPQEKFGDLSVL